MEIKLYKVNNSPIEMNKTLTNEITVNGRLRAECSVENPVIELEYSSSLTSYNYAYIPEFRRYYFIEPPVYSGKYLTFTMKEDYLYSWKNDILSSQGTATRSNYGNNTIKDNMILELPKKRVEYRKLGNAITGSTYVVIIGG